MKSRACTRGCRLDASWKKKSERKKPRTHDLCVWQSKKFLGNRVAMIAIRSDSPNKQDQSVPAARRARPRTTLIDSRAGKTCGAYCRVIGSVLNSEWEWGWEIRAKTGFDGTPNRKNAGNEEGEGFVVN